MIIKNIYGDPMFFGWIGELGRRLVNNETTEVDDEVTQEQDFLNAIDNGYIEVLSYNDDDFDYVVQKEMKDGLASVRARLFRDVITVAGSGDTVFPLTHSVAQKSESLCSVNGHLQEYGPVGDYYIDAGDNLIWNNKDYVLDPTDVVHLYYVVLGLP